MPNPLGVLETTYPVELNWRSYIAVLACTAWSSRSKTPLTGGISLLQIDEGSGLVDAQAFRRFGDSIQLTVNVRENWVQDETTRYKFGVGEDGQVSIIPWR